MIEVRLAGRDKCTGCGVCATVCPTNSIEMFQDNEGFWFPKIKDSCIGCGKCTRSCPVISKPIVQKLVEQKACIAIYKDNGIWKKSSSGGAFTAICNLFGDEQTIVFGARFDAKNKCIHHDWVEGIQNIGVFRGSKYVQSLMGDCLYRAKTFLDAGKRVIFSGTPCQIAALRSYLGKREYENLLCIDLICHGVGSPKVFADYINCLIEKKKSTILDYEFRHKIIKFGIHELYNTKITYENGIEDVIRDDVYNNLFLQKIICRKSCDNCEYACSQRMGDLTIGDAKQMYSINGKIPYDRNGSVIICNTMEGKRIFDLLSKYMSIYHCSLRDVVKTNHPFSKCIHSTSLRNVFFDGLDKTSDVIVYMKHWTTETSLLQKVKRHIPDKIKGIIKKYL